jgi:hypothetical protein
VVGFKEYINDSINFWSTSEIYYVSTKSPVSPSFTPAPTSEVTPNPTPTFSDQTSTPTISPSAPEFGSTINYLSALLGVLIVGTVFVIVKKKRYVTIKISS